MTMKKKLTLSITAITLAALVAIGATLAWFTDQKNVTNVVTMGNVKITLTEPIFSAKNENNSISGVMPNQSITKDPTIKNVGKNDAYIRTQITYEGLTPEQAAQVEEKLNINTADWAKSTDGYYYYQHILKPGDAPIALFTTLNIPNWGNEVVDMNFKVNIVAGAVQSDFFTPDTDATTHVINGWSAFTA